MRDGAGTVTGWDEIRRRLEEQRGRIAEEISSYPTPIAACDAHINALLAERERVNEELNRLDEAVRRGAAVEDFLANAR